MDQIIVNLPDMYKAAASPNRNEPAFGLLRFGELRQTYSLDWPLTTAEAQLPTTLFRDLLMSAVERIRFDERYYLHSYADVVDALAKGLFRDAHHHYVAFG